MTKLFIRLDFEPTGSVLSPGMIQVLEAVQKMKSIRRAAASLNISYRKTWLMVQQMQKTFNGPVVLAESGGFGGGATELTAIGIKVLMHYHAIEKLALIAAQKDLEVLAAMVRPGAPPRRHERG